MGTLMDFYRSWPGPYQITDLTNSATYAQIQTFEPAYSNIYPIYRC